jgi:uncharacterized membrane protein
MDQPSEKPVGNVQRTLVTAGSKRATLRTLGKPLAAIVLGSLLSISQAAHAQNKYDFIPIDVPKATRTAANGNSTHEIVGEFDDMVDGKTKTHGFILNKGAFTTVDVPPELGVATQINGINAPGQLMGTYFESTGTTHAFFLTKGAVTTLDPPGAIRSQGGFINAQGQAVGTYRTLEGTFQKRHGFIWRKGNFTTFNVPKDHPEFGTVAMGINDIGEVVGNFVDESGDNFHRHGFLRSSKGTFTTFDVPGRTFTSPTGINNSGQIVGFYADDNFFFHGFVLHKGVFTFVDVPGASETQIFSINAKGEIVGTYFDADDGEQHGFVGSPTR